MWLGAGSWCRRGSMRSHALFWRNRRAALLKKGTWVISMTVSCLEVDSPIMMKMMHVCFHKSNAELQFFKQSSLSFMPQSSAGPVLTRVCHLMKRFSSDVCMARGTCIDTVEMLRLEIRAMNNSYKHTHTHTSHGTKNISHMFPVNPGLSSIVSAVSGFPRTLSSYTLPSAWMK